MLTTASDRWEELVVMLTTTTADAATITSGDVIASHVTMTSVGTDFRAAAAAAAAAVVAATAAGVTTNESTPNSTDVLSSADVCRFGALRDTVWLSVVISIGFLLFILIVVFGNLCVVVAFSCNPRLRSPVNMFYISMASADMLVGLLAMPMMLVYQLHGCWPLGVLACDAWIAVDLLGCSASIFTLCYVAWDRYVAIAHPLRHRVSLTTARSRRVICALWAFAAVFWVPGVFVLRAMSHETVDYECLFLVPKLYVLITNTVGFYLPMTVAVTCSAMLIIVLRRSLRLDILSGRRPTRGYSSTSTGAVTDDTSSVSVSSVQMHVVSGACSDVTDSTTSLPASAIAAPPSDQTSRQHPKSNLSRDSRAVRMLVVIVVAFLACWLPWVIVWPVMTYRDGDVADWLYDLTMWAGYANSLINPFLYVFINRNFRTYFKRLVCRKSA